MSALPGWLAVVLAAAMLGVAAGCAIRLAVSRRAAGLLGARPVERDLDLCHLLMGVAMAGMLVAGLATLPAWLWAAVFAGYGLWFAGRLLLASGRRGSGLAGHYGPHLLMAVAMVYMLLAMPSMPATAGPMPGMNMSMAGGSAPAAALVLGALSFADAALVAHRLRRRRPVRVPALAPALVLTPSLEVPAIRPAVAETGAPVLRRLLGARSATAGHVLMAVTMGAMLVTMR